MLHFIYQQIKRKLKSERGHKEDFQTLGWSWSAAQGLSSLAEAGSNQGNLDLDPKHLFGFRWNRFLKQTSSVN